MILQIISFDEPVWRLLPRGLAAQPAVPAYAPEGRFHHSGHGKVTIGYNAQVAVDAEHKRIRHRHRERPISDATTPPDGDASRPSDQTWISTRSDE